MPITGHCSLASQSHSHRIVVHLFDNFVLLFVLTFGVVAEHRKLTKLIQNRDISALDLMQNIVCVIVMCAAAESNGMDAMVGANGQSHWCLCIN